MGLLFLASLTAILAAGAASLAGVVASFSRNRSVLAYWLVSLIGMAFTIYIYFPLSPPVSHGGEYGKLASLAEAGFSFTNLIAFIGGLFCIFLARAESSLDRAVSGIAWSFLFAFAARLFAHLI